MGRWVGGLVSMCWCVCVCDVCVVLCVCCVVLCCVWSVPLLSLLCGGHSRVCIVFVCLEVFPVRLSCEGSSDRDRDRDRDRQKQRETEKEDRNRERQRETEKERQDKTRKEKTRQ